MKRIVLWCMSTLTALVLLFGYHTSTSSQAAAGGQSSAVAPVQGSTSSGTSSGTTSTDGSSSGSDTTPGTGTSTGTGTATASATVTGDEASTRWGPVQVQLTVANGAITDVSVVEYPDNNGRDA